MLVTVRVLDDVPPWRRGRFVRAFRETLSQCAQRLGFRVVHYSIQDDNAHFLVEAQGKVWLANGMKSLAARFARCVNRVFGRVGRVLADRCHHAVKRAPPPGRYADAGRGREVATPRSWLLSRGWRRIGLIDPAEVPGGARERRGPTRGTDAPAVAV